jgi:LruC domain-containing protein
MKSKVVILLLTVISLMSCVTDNQDPTNDLQLPEKFTYTTTKTLKIKVKVNDTYNNQYFYKVEFFDRNPFATDTVAKLISAGLAKGNSPLESEFVLPAYKSKIYVQQTDPLQRKTVKLIDLTNNIADQLVCNFGVDATASGAPARVSAKVVAADPHAADYALPATYTTLGSGSVTLSGTKYYVPAGVTNQQISFGWLENSELYVAGNVTFNESFYMPPHCKLVVMPGGVVTFNVAASVEQNGDVLAVYSGATMTFNQFSAVGYNSTLVIDGTVNANSGYEIRSNSTVFNHGTINSTVFTMTNNTTFKNNGYLNLSDKFVMNSNTTFTNNGVLSSTNKIITNNTTAIIYNYNTIRTGFVDMNNGGGVLNNYCKVISKDLGVNGATVNSYTGSLIECDNLYANNTVFSLFGNAILRTGTDYAGVSAAISEGVTFNYGVTINGVADGQNVPVVFVTGLNNRNGWKVLSLGGNMQYVLAAGETAGENYYNSIGGGVLFVQNSTVKVEDSGCNNGGVNADQGNNAPSNPEFPMEVVEGNEYVFAMEDLWPNLGDYDMNDFVFQITNIKKKLNADNKVVSMSFDIKPLANGSTKSIATAIQFDKIAAGNVSVSSTDNLASVEQGQIQSNVILFQQVHTLFGNTSPVITNTYAQVAKKVTKNYNFSFSFNSPVDAANVTVDKLNFYVIVGDVESADRKEIHLAGYAPSTKVKKNVNNYKDSNNMVWAIMIPTGDFKYPTESTKIFDAYPKFNTWAESAGAIDSDWYLHPINNTAKVYSK